MFLVWALTQYTRIGMCGSAEVNKLYSLRRLYNMLFFFPLFLLPLLLPLCWDFYFSFLLTLRGCVVCAARLRRCLCCCCRCRRRHSHRLQYHHPYLLAFCVMYYVLLESVYMRWIRMHAYCLSYLFWYRLSVSNTGTGASDALALSSASFTRCCFFFFRHYFRIFFVIVVVVVLFWLHLITLAAYRDTYDRLPYPRTQDIHTRSHKLRIRFVCAFLFLLLFLHSAMPEDEIITTKTTEEKKRQQ